MKKLTEFKGKVLAFNVESNISKVSLTELATGKTIETTIFTNKLKEKNIGMGDDYSIIIEDDGGRITTQFIKINKPTPEHDSFDI